MKVLLWILCILLLMQEMESQDKAMGLVRNPGKEKRIALVIGNAAYEYDALENTVNDADDIAVMLKKFGFEVILKKNCTKRQMKDAIDAFGEKLDKESIGLFYYSGHGAQILGENYLIPIQHDIRLETDVEYEAISANKILRMMEYAESLVNIMILDACRNNPFGKSFRPKSKTGFRQGLAEMKANGSIVIYATGAGSTASDNQGERNGLFTKYLLKYMPSGKNLFSILTKVNKEVQRESQSKQRPFLYSGLTEDFYFSTPSVPHPTPGPTPPSVDIDMADLEKWNEYSKKMKASYEKIQAGGMEAGIKKVAWERFLGSFMQDNPYSQEDETMRAEAQKGIEQCIRELSKKSVEFEIKEVKTQDSSKQAKSAFQPGETVYVNLNWLVKSLEGGEKEEVEIQGEGISLYSQTIRDKSKEGEWQIALPLTIQRAGTYRANVSLKIGRLQKQSSLWFEVKKEESRCPEGWNAGEWQECWKGEYMDFTVDTWTRKPWEEQSRLSKAYRAWYAQQKGLAEEKTMSKAGISIEMCLVPPGRFQMGSPGSEAGRYSDEQQHRVLISKPYYIGKYEVTKAQWQAVMGTGIQPYFKNSPSNAPMESISWTECQDFCSKVGMSLPTEAQWEHACRSGVSYATYQGNVSDPGNMAWYSSNSSSSTHAVGGKAANAWGIHDMLGNVWEWCMDWYGDYAVEDAQDPVGPSSGSYRVYRGGSWNVNARSCRAASRYSHTPEYRGSYLGFRLQVTF